MRTFPGSFHCFDPTGDPVPSERFAPSTQITVGYAGSQLSINFMIDTGTESTVLYPRDAKDLLEQALDEVDFGTIGDRVLLGGVEGEFSAAAQIPVSLTFFDDVDAPETFNTTILVAQPSPPNLDDPEAGRGNWDTPSLLGRDLLLHFDLHASGARGEVYLSLPD